MWSCLGALLNGLIQSSPWGIGCVRSSCPKVRVIGATNPHWKLWLWGQKLWLWGRNPVGTGCLASVSGDGRSPVAVASSVAGHRDTPPAFIPTKPCPAPMAPVLKGRRGILTAINEAGGLSRPPLLGQAVSLDWQLFLPTGQVSLVALECPA